MSLCGWVACFRWKVVHFWVCQQSISHWVRGSETTLFPFSSVRITNTNCIHLNCGKFWFFFVLVSFQHSTESMILGEVHYIFISMYIYYMQLFVSLRKPFIRIGRAFCLVCDTDTIYAKLFSWTMSNHHQSPKQLIRKVFIKHVPPTPNRFLSTYIRLTQKLNNFYF